jgi:hypothetical protein
MFRSQNDLHLSPSTPALSLPKLFLPTGAA